MGLSTLKWTTDRDYWQEWYPADFVTESFPGQFRNWFYALITESTVMTGQAPFKTLFGYALLRDEHGEEMHKSKGNAIWFDDAAEQIGADVMRWMFSAANPAVNMNFGYHLAHEEVRRFFLPLWNTYGFFVTYARLDGWTPRRGGRWRGRRPHAARPLGPVAAGRRDRGGARPHLTATTRSAPRGRSRRSWTSCRTGTSAATGAASGRGSWTMTSAPPTPPCTGCWWT